jgi:hypothetical protein
MKRRSYDDLVSEVKWKSELIGLYDKLMSLGIPKSIVTSFHSVCVHTGYSMGEETVIKCNDVVVFTHDTRSRYDGKWRGKERYGRSVIKFNKKQLREFLELCKEIDNLEIERRDRNSYWVSLNERLNDRQTDDSELENIRHNIHVELVNMESLSNKRNEVIKKAESLALGCLDFSECCRGYKPKVALTRYNKGLVD